MNPWTIQWVVAFSFGLRYFLSDRLPPLPHESWEISSWSPIWSPELRWVNLGVFLVFILTWFWLNRKRGPEISIKPILLFHFFTPVMVLTATWSPLPTVWLTLLISLALTFETPVRWRWVGMIPVLALGWLYPLAHLFLPGLVWAAFHQETSTNWTRRIAPSLAILTVLALTFLKPMGGKASVDLLSEVAFHFGWANLCLLGLLCLSATLGSLRQRLLSPFEQALLWLVIPALSALFSCRDLQQCLTVLALPFPFLLALICRYAFTRPSKAAFSLACLALSLSHLPLAIEGAAPKGEPWFHVDWAFNAEKSHRLKTLIKTLESELNEQENIVLASHDQQAILSLMTDLPVLSYPPKELNSSYSKLHRPGFWILKSRLDNDQLKEKRNLLGGLGFWKQISIGSGKNNRQHFWIYRFDRLKMPF